MTCPQCSQIIDGIQHTSYAVGWCQQDIHLSCYGLHVRTCRLCRPHNEGFILREDLQYKPKPDTGHAA